MTRSDERVADVIRRAGAPTDAAYVRGAQFYGAEGRAGRIGIDLDRVLRDVSYRDNLILFAGEWLHIPQYQLEVIVEGAVNSPVSVAHVPGHGTGYYVDRAGGFARWADKGRTYVVQPNGGDQRVSARPEPGACVVVPARSCRRAEDELAGILGSVATILTSALTIVLVVQRL